MEASSPPLAVILGATGGTGLQLIDQALERGLRVRAAVRNPDKLKAKKNLEIVKVDVFDTASLSEAFSGASVVFSALGGYPGIFRQELHTRTGPAILAAMQSAGVPRLVICSSICTTNSSEHPFMLEWVIKPLFLGATLQDLRRWEMILETEAASRGVTYTVVKPPRLLNGELAKNEISVLEGQYNPHMQPGGIPRANVAAFMIDCYQKDLWMNKLVACGLAAAPSSV